jgi:hypothetical protein
MPITIMGEEIHGSATLTIALGKNVTHGNL